MTGIPYDQLLDERVAVLAFVMVIVLLTTLLGLGIPLLKLLSRMTEAGIAAQSKAETALAGATAAHTVKLQFRSSTGASVSVSHASLVVEEVS